METLASRLDTNTTEPFALELTRVAVYASSARVVPNVSATDSLDYLVPFESGEILQSSTLKPNTTLFSLPRNACMEHPNICDEDRLSVRMIAFFTDSLFNSSDGVRGSVTSVILGDGSLLNLTQPLVYFQPQQVRSQPFTRYWLNVSNTSSWHHFFLLIFCDVPNCSILVC